MKKIKLRGKYAVGDYQYAIVDDEDYEELNQYKWKAKWNGSKSNIYAIRSKSIDSKMTDIRMHRVVMNAPKFDGSNDIDHINHNSLDNRKANLRIVSRKVNGNNKRIIKVSGVCISCGKDFIRNAIVGLDHRIKRCSNNCNEHIERYYKPKPKSLPKYINKICVNCCQPFQALDREKNRQKFCNSKCRHRFKNMVKTIYKRDRKRRSINIVNIWCGSFWKGQSLEGSVAAKNR